MNEDTYNVWTKVRTREIDINNQQLFFSIILKGFIYKINQELSLRDIKVPHYILNTGDDIMYLEVKGQDHSIERPMVSGQTPVVSNEDFIYSQVPRCMIQPKGVNIPTDQLSNPYSHGSFELEYDDMIYTFRAEFRRLPITYGVSLKYYFDSFTDMIDVAQQIIANLSFINRYNVVYLGRKIECSYNIPDSFDGEYMAEFDGITTDSKYRTLALDFDIQTNMPMIYSNTVIPMDAIITKTVLVNASNPKYDEHGLPIDTGITVYPKGGIESGAEGESGRE